MAKFRKKPVVVDAVQYMGAGLANPGPPPAGVCLGGRQCAADIADGLPHVHTLEGTMTVSPRDWIITGVKGERYPCKPDVFEATYERVMRPGEIGDEDG